MKTLQLPEPERAVEYPLMQALQNRRSKRKITHGTLSRQELSNLLWAACGETKKATKRSKNRRTMPSACNAQKVSVYVALESGVYRYDEPSHSLHGIHETDMRANLVKQPMLKHAPVGLVYVEHRQMKSGIICHDEIMQALLVGTEVGAMSQNVYLYCAAAGLNTVLVGLCDQEAIGKLIGLGEEQVVVFTQVVG